MVRPSFEPLQGAHLTTDGNFFGKLRALDYHDIFPNNKPYNFIAAAK